MPSSFPGMNPYIEQDAPNAGIDLQEILHHVSDATGYEDFIYASPPVPKFSSKDAAWARAFVPSRP